MEPRKLIIDGRWVGYWIKRGDEWHVVPRTAGHDPVTAIAVSAGVNIAWQMYQYSNAPSPPGQGQYTPANSIVYGPDGTITSENTWVPDGSPAGGHFESRTFKGYGKEPEKPKFDGKPPDPRSFDVRGESGGDGGRETPGVLGEDSPEYQAALDKYNSDKAAFDSSQQEWETEHAEWQANKDKFDKQQAVLSDLEGKSLAIMNQGVDEIVQKQVIQDQKENLIKQQNELLDPQIAEQRQIEAETSMARGQTGSRAAVDRGATMDKAVLDAKRTINENASAYAYALANQEVNNAMGVYGTVQNTRNADAALSLQKQGLAQQGFLQQNQQGLARYGVDQNAPWNKYLAETQRHQGLTQGVSSTINGLAFLYGFKGQGGPTPKTPYPFNPTTGGATYNPYG